MKRTFKYTTSFASVVRCLVEDEKDKFLSKASLESLAKLVPERFKDSVDLLPVALNACVVNRMNVNGDCVDTPVALSIASGFCDRPINIEHQRFDIVGHLVNSGFSKFNLAFAKDIGSELVTAAALKDTKEPFNISLAGVVYKILGDTLVETLEASSDPESPLFMSVSASWELGFDDYNIAVGGKNLADCEIITDPEKKKKYEPYLKSNKGSGKTSDGKYVFRVLAGEVAPLAIGLTSTPAADVKGIVVPRQEAQKTSEATLENDKKGSQETKTIVKDSSMKKTIASIDELKGLKDEQLSEYSVASISQVLEKAIKDADTKWQSQVNAEKETATKALATAEEANKTLVTVKGELDTVKGELKTMKEAKAQEEATALFNGRMELLAKAYKLDDNDRKVIAKQIQGMTAEAFDAWQKDFEVLASGKKVEAPKTPETDAGKTAGTAIASAKPVEGQAAPANAGPGEETDLRKKYAKAFTKDQVVVTK